MSRAVWAERLHQALLDPLAAQAQLLNTLVEASSGTVFGREHGLASVRTLADFRRAVPLTSTDALAPYVERMLSGEPDVLVPGRPVFFARTSGTSGAPKHVPYPPQTELEYLAAMQPMLHAIEGAHPGATGVVLNVTGKHREDVAPCGITIGSASGFARNLPSFTGDPYLRGAPEEVFEMTDYEARYRRLLELALEKDLRMICALNPSTLLALFGKLTQWAAELSRTARPDVAERLTASLKRHGRVVPGDVWPRLKVLQTWKGGAAAHYLEQLKSLCPSCPVWSSISGSSEGLLMVPLKADWSGGVPALTSSVLELFDAEAEGEPQAVELTDAEAGRGYRVALTNRRGMFRVLMDDVFYVEGFYERAPILRFSHRHGLVSSLTGEKITEAHVISAVEHAQKVTGLTPLEYLWAPEWGDPARYLLVVEVGGAFETERWRGFLREVESGLGDANVEYREKRRSGRLGNPVLVSAPAGTFERWRKERAKGKSDAQVKVPRLRRELFERGALQPAATVELTG